MKRASLLFIVLFGWGLSQPVLAHGARIEYQESSAIVIRATFDDGTPMANAQATVYAPQDPQQPWMTGTTDDSGRFTFVPDSTAGDWSVKVRQSGHGGIVSIPVAEEQIALQSAPLLGGYSWGQKWLMAIAICWGFVGTALYFSRK